MNNEEQMIIFPKSEYLTMLKTVQGKTLINDALPQLQKALSRISPQVMNAMTGDRDFVKNTKDMVYSMQVMPIFVRKSPLVNLLKYDVKSKNLYVPFDNCLRVLLDLKMFRMQVMTIQQEKMIPFNISYLNQLEMAETRLVEDLLPPLYEAWKAQSMPKEQILDQFCKHMVWMTFQEINLLERFIYQCLFQGQFPMQWILTPQEPLDIKYVPENEQQNFKTQIRVYFDSLEKQHNEVLTEEEKWFNLDNCPSGILWNNFMPIEIIEQFFLFMNLAK